MFKYFLLVLVLLPQVSYAANPYLIPIQRKVLETEDIPGTDQELRLMLVVMPPGAASRPHIHPVAGLNYIIEGTVESQYEGEPVKVFKAGDSYQDIPNRKHLIFRNVSKTQPLKFIIAFKIKKGEPFRRDVASILEMLQKHHQ